MAYTIDTIQEQENQAQVTVNVQYQLTVPGMVDLPMAMAIKGHWVRLEDNQWYRNMETRKVPARPQIKRAEGCCMSLFEGLSIIAYYLQLMVDWRGIMADESCRYPAE